MPSALTIVITTIQEPSPSVLHLVERTAHLDIPVLVLGDKKGPREFAVAGTELVSLDDQKRLPFELATALPTGHYCRKNLGYLLAVQRGTLALYETDDDNAPNEHWRPRDMTCRARVVESGHWINVFRLFSDEFIWPRGFPLEMVRDSGSDGSHQLLSSRVVESPIQQGLVDGSPDVDAIWRLLLDRPFRFDQRESVLLGRGCWCPFNSQSTWWWPPAYPLLYLPSYCSLRMTDIWRSFVAQRCLWELGYGVTFHAPEAIQERNSHNLLRDFQDEVPGYCGNARLTRTLEELRLEAGSTATCENLIRCYEALIRDGHFPEEEMKLVRAWVADYQRHSTEPRNQHVLHVSIPSQSSSFTAKESFSTASDGHRITVWEEK